MTRNSLSELRSNIGLAGSLTLITILMAASPATASGTISREDRTSLPAPKPEPVRITALPLPPTAPADVPDSCTLTINPRGTGCISASEYGLQEGPGAMWDNRHVLMTVTFTGAPSAAGPASIYSGEQVIAIRTDGTLFPNGDAWKCLTCGVPEDHRKGTLISENPMAAAGDAYDNSKIHAPQMPLDHPQAFPDGKRILAGPNVIDCGPYLLVSPQCTADRVHIYPVHWHRTVNGSDRRAIFREQRLNPDGVHMNWNAFAPSPGGIEQFGYLGRLVFNPAPTTGDPSIPRYDIEDVYLLVNNSDPFQSFTVDPANPGKLIHNDVRGAIGEMRGWTRDGRSVIGMGFAESGNADIFITDLKAGHSHRLTRDPAYTDPMMMSPDDKWFVAMDGRTTDRHLYYSAMQGIPPLIDMLTLAIEVCCYNNGNRRFFQPILIDAQGDRGSYRGQQLNAGATVPGGPGDPDWNGRADPAWSPDGTKVIYWQALVTSPACGKENQMPCPVSTEPGGRRTRLMMAHLTSRKPQKTRTVAAKPIKVDWGIPLRPSDPLPLRRGAVPAGVYRMDGKVGGTADVKISYAQGSMSAIEIRYTGYTDDGEHIIDGQESATREGSGLLSRVIWHSDLRSSGLQNGTKKTSPDGFIFSFHGPISGELITTIDGKAYRQPRPGN